MAEYTVVTTKEAIMIKEPIIPSCMKAAKFEVSPLKEQLSINVDDVEKLVVKTMHLSCKSHAYRPGHKYGGMIIYQYNGKSEWRTANNTHCLSGYIVIQDTNSESVKRWKEGEPGQVHGAVYRNTFGESVRKAKVVGEGFAVRDRFEMVSRVFNNPQGSEFHDSRETMNEASVHCVRKIVGIWKQGGSSFVSRKRNFKVKDLLEDFME